MVENVTEADREELRRFISSFAKRVRSSGIPVTVLHHNGSRSAAVLTMDSKLQRIAIEKPNDRSTVLHLQDVSQMIRVCQEQSIYKDFSGYNIANDLLSRMVGIKSKPSSTAGDLLLLCQDETDRHEIVSALSLFGLFPRFSGRRGSSNFSSIGSWSSAGEIRIPSPVSYAPAGGALGVRTSPRRGRPPKRLSPVRSESAADEPIILPTTSTSSTTSSIIHPPPPELIKPVVPRLRIFKSPPPRKHPLSARTNPTPRMMPHVHSVDMAPASITLVQKPFVTADLTGWRSPMPEYPATARPWCCRVPCREDDAVSLQMSTSPTQHKSPIQRPENTPRRLQPERLPTETTPKQVVSLSPDHKLSSFADDQMFRRTVEVGRVNPASPATGSLSSSTSPIFRPNVILPARTKFTSPAVRMHSSESSSTDSSIASSIWRKLETGPSPRSLVVKQTCKAKAIGEKPEQAVVKRFMSVSSEVRVNIVPVPRPSVEIHIPPVETTEIGVWASSSSSDDPPPPQVISSELPRSLFADNRVSSTNQLSLHSLAPEPVEDNSFSMFFRTPMEDESTWVPCFTEECNSVSSYRRISPPVRLRQPAGDRGGEEEDDEIYTTAPLISPEDESIDFVNLTENFSKFDDAQLHQSPPQKSSENRDAASSALDRVRRLGVPTPFERAISMRKEKDMTVPNLTTSFRSNE